jgi:hypothetical protein
MKKNYLQEQLLNTISNNTIENNIEVYILQLIVKIRSLENKGHIELALKCIRQAIKLCEETENFILLLRCLNIEQSFYPYLHENTEKTIHAQIKYNDTLETLIRINLLDKTILNISKIYEEENKIGTNESNDKLIELLNQLPREESYLFNREKANYHQIKFAVYYKTQDYKSSYSHITNTIKYMNKNLYYIYEDKWMYITALINAAHNALKLDLNEDIDIYFNQIDELIINELFKQNTSFIAEAKKLSMTHQLIIYLFQKNYQKIISLEKEATNLFSTTETSTYFTKPRNMNICFAIANTAISNYTKAYHWAIEEIKNPNSRDYEIYTLICYFVKLIYFIENEMIDNFDSEYLSATRYIRGKKNFADSDKKLLKLLDKLKTKNNLYKNKTQIQKHISLYSDMNNNYLYHFIFEYIQKKIK